jgi:hypothetical protein
MMDYVSRKNVYSMDENDVGDVAAIYKIHLCEGKG